MGKVETVQKARGGFHIVPENANPAQHLRRDEMGRFVKTSFANYASIPRTDDPTTVTINLVNLPHRDR